MPTRSELERLARWAESKAAEESIRSPQPTRVCRAYLNFADSIWALASCLPQDAAVSLGPVPEPPQKPLMQEPPPAEPSSPETEKAEEKEQLSDRDRKNREIEELLSRPKFQIRTKKERSCPQCGEALWKAEDGWTCRTCQKSWQIP